MKKLSLQSFIALLTLTNSQSKSKNVKTLLLAMLFCFAGYSGYGQVSVSSAGGGTGICPTEAVGGGATAYTALGTMTVTENIPNDLSAGANVITLNPPSGWQFNTGSLPTFAFTGGEDITGISGSYSGGNLAVTVTTSGTANIDQFTITGLQVEATSPSSSAGYVYSSVAFIPGITTGSSGTDFADVSLATPLVPSVSISVSPTGSVCTGTNLTFTPAATNGGTSPTYQWYVNGSFVGSGATYSTSTLANGDNVTCVMTVGGVPSCTYPLTATSGAITASINPLPTAVTVSGGGTYCGSETVTASNGGSGTIYFQGTTSGGTSTATPATTESLTSSGTYYFRAQSAAGCWGTQGAVTVTINPVPGVVSVSGGATTCGTAQTITASGGAGGTIYFENTTSNGTSTATPSVSQSESSSGTYYFRAEEGTCWGTQGSAVVTVNPLPTAYTVTGGGSYCSGGSGVAVGLSNSTSGVNYELFLGGVTTGIVKAGTGSAIAFGLQTAAGTYTAVATNATTLCTNNMTGSVSVTINPLPTSYAMSGGGDYCAGGGGELVGVSNSTLTVNYQLYIGGVATGTAVAGSGSAISFGSQTAGGTYTAVATDANGCTNNMSGSEVVTVDPLPTAYTVTGGGSYCSGGSGAAVGLSNSTTGVNYELFLGGVTTGIIVGGTSGSAITFGPQTATGTYTVVATNTTTSCTSNMSGSVAVSTTPLPTIYAMAGGGGYCSGGSGIGVGLANSTSGVTYSLYLGGVATGTTKSGTGSAITFGLQTATGTYTAVGTDTHSCTSNMSGTSVVSINPLPTPESVTGSGSYCSGGSGVAVGLSNSVIGDTYQLYLGITPTGGSVSGSGSAITFGFETATGTYTAIATTTVTGCTNSMTGSAVISVNPLPAAYTVTGGGSLCAGATGVAVGLSNSATGVNYELFLGGVTTGIIVPGTGAAITFGLQTTAGNYTIVATNTTTSCTNNMSGSATVIVNPLPAAYTFTSFGITGYCVGATGVTIDLVSSDIGVNYQLYLGGVAHGGTVPGTGGLLSFGPETIAGTYTLVGTNASTGCINNMSGSVTITVNPLPIAFSVTGGGSYCAGGAGMAIGLTGSAAGINYQLYLSGLPVAGAAVAGTGSAITFGLQTGAGVYTVVGTDAVTGCTSNMTGSETIIINPLPNAYSMIGGGGYCTGSTGAHVGLSSSDAGVSYELYRGGVATGIIIPGTGLSLDFGLQTIVAAYTAVATNTTTGCNSNMAGSVSVSVNPLPLFFTISSGGSYCAGGAGIDLTLSGSESGVNYQLYNGLIAIGGAVPGTGAGALDLGFQTAGGIYTAVATNATTGCTNNMTGSATITVNALPVVYTVTGGGAYCSGGTGVHVGLSGSDLAITYQLYLGGGLVATKTGTGSALDFGLQTGAGSYSVVASNPSSGCTSNMTGAVTVSINALPNVYTVTSFGLTDYCSGGAGINIFLVPSDATVNYQLYLAGVATGSSLPGNGGVLNFGAQTAAGTYTVAGTDAVTGCNSNMGGSVTISIDPLPVAYAVTGGGSYCTGGTGVAVGLANSASGINYELFLGGVTTGIIVPGSGAAITFGLQTAAGVYTVVAANTTTTCTSNMTGSVTIGINPLPTAYTVTGGGAYCAGGTGVDIQLSSSDIGMSYQLYDAGVATGGAMPGTGSALDFGLQTGSGAYTAVATNTATTCTNNMLGAPVITINPLPNQYTVTGGGSYCSGGTGEDVGLSNSDASVNYQLVNAFAPVGLPLPGINAALDFGFQTASGFYTVTATDGITGCTNTMTGGVAVTILPLPTVYNMTGGGAYCSGGSGVDVGLSNSDFNNNYELYLGGVTTGTIMAGTGGALDFGLQTTAGVYTIVAANTITGCTNNMSGTSTVSVNPLPTAFNVSGGGNYCFGGAGQHVFLSGSETGDNYELFVSGVSTGVIMAGTGSALDFGSMTVGGIYTVVATNTTTTCTSNMLLNATIVVNPLPVAYAVTGGGAYCAGGAGEDVGLSSSDIGFTYQLYLSGVPILSPMAGTGSALDFGFQMAAGTYTVVGTNNVTGCTNNMSGGVVIVINPLPTVYTVGGSGAYCSGGTGVNITLSSSDLSINYQPYLGGVLTGSFVAGTGSALSINETGVGTYTIVATDAITGCTNNMTGTATVSVNPLPVAITGATNECVGTSATLSDASGGGTWSSDNTLVATIDPASGVVTTVSAGTYNVSYTFTTTGCLISGLDTVDALPAVTPIVGVPDLCTGNFALFADATPGGTWSSSNTTIASVDAFGMVTGVSGGSVTLTYDVTSAFGCDSFVTTPLTILPAPAVSAITGALANVCTGLTMALSDATTGGTWTSGNTALATVDATGIVTGVAPGIVDISYTVTNLSGCAASAIYTMTIGNPMPTSIVLPVGSVTLCHGNPVTMYVASAGSGLTYSWDNSGTPIAGATDSSYVTTATGIFTATISNGTCSESLAPVNVAAPPVPVISFDTVGNLLYTGSFSSYQWFLNGDTVAGATSSTIPISGGGNYMVAVSDGNGCVDTSLAFVVVDTTVTTNHVGNIISSDEIRIYPNPATSILYIDAPEKVYVTVLTTDGKILMGQREARSLNVGELANGMYIIMVYDENNVLLKTDKFVKMQ